MKSLTICNDSGEIIRSVSCSSEMASVQVQAGEFAIDGIFDGNDFYIDVVEMIAVSKPKRPSGNVLFDINSKSWEPVISTPAQLAEIALMQRFQLLSHCDWSQLPDVPEATQLLWREYRQALRDITLQTGYPQKISWPALPI